jgi:translation initiation factor 2B subunit (eIF-2B alpha/beta/delta family)
MAPVLNLLNRVCVIKEKAGDDWSEFENLFAAIVRQPDDYLDRMKSQIDRIPRAENTLIAFSNSSTVAQVIIAASKAANWPRRVFCSESRPVMEGIVLARKLTAAGLDVTLFTDAALMSRVVEADAVWVGGDSLSREGLVNKVGSRALAMLCKFQGIPFVSLMGSDKLLPTALTPYFHFLPQNPREIGADEADGLNIHNEYYEVIPLELVSHIVTEDGVHSPHELISTIENEPLSPLFERILGS